MRKRALIPAVLLITFIIAALFVRTGFTKRSDVYINKYSISEDGSNLVISTSLLGSMGFIRSCTVKDSGNKKYMTFYSAFGGLNSNIGAKDQFEISLNPDCTEIYFYRGKKDYDLVLIKNGTTNAWEKPE